MRSQRLLPILILILIWTSITCAQVDTYTYSYIPKHVFATQVFPVTVSSSREENAMPPTFHFDPSSPIRPIKSTPLTGSNGGNTFYTFYFRAHQDDIIIPALEISHGNNTTTLENHRIPVEILDSSKQKGFCGLIATSCKILTSQVSEFDARNNLISLTIKASEANPQEIHTPNSMESGIEKLTTKNAESLIEYYFVIPSSQKSVTSSYYNTLQNRFISKTISTDYDNQPVAAQESLNRNDGSYDRLKKYGLSFLALFFFWMFWKKKEIFFLVLFAVCLLILLTLFTPHEKICVQQGALLYILPTQTSTTGSQVDREFTTSVLNRRNTYYKIEYDHHVIGWIKDEDTCKN